MRFTPKSKEEIEMEGLIQEGTYPFKLIKAEEKQSTKGQVYFNVRLAVFCGGEAGVTVFDNPSPEFMVFKFAHLCEATGIGGKYQSGNVDCRDLEGLEGYCKIGIQEAKNGYPAKNIVLDYVESPHQKSQPKPIQTSKPADAPNAEETTPPVEDDDVPF